MRDRDLIQAVMQGVQFDASDDYDLARRLAIIAEVLDPDPLVMAGRLLARVRDLEKSLATQVSS